MTEHKERARPYSLELTAQDVRTIAFVGGRYSWASELSALEEGTNELTEWDAWDIRDAIERDTEGGHAFLPMLDSSSELYSKIMNLYEAIV